MQAYGDAVLDEAPLLVVSNFRQTYFVRRNIHDVADKTLYASPLIAHDHPADVLPPLAAWLYVLRLAHDWSEQGVKQTLPCNQVPVTPAQGYTLPPGSDHTVITLHAKFSGGSHVKGPRRSPRNAAQSQHGRGTQRNDFQAEEPQAGSCQALVSPAECQQAEALQAALSQAVVSQAAFGSQASRMEVSQTQLSGRRKAGACTGNKRRQTLSQAQALQQQQQQASDIHSCLAMYLEAENMEWLPELTPQQLNLTTCSLAASSQCKVLKVRMSWW